MCDRRAVNGLDPVHRYG